MTDEVRRYGSSFDHLRDLLEKVRLLLLWRMRAQLLIESQSDEGGHRVAQFLLENAEPHRMPRDEELDSLLEAVDATVRGRAEQSDASVLRWDRVTRGFGLSPLDQSILLACLAPSFSTGFEHAFRGTGAEFVGGRMPLTYVADLLARGDEERWEILRALHPSSRLVRSGLVTMSDSDSGSPLVAARVAPSPILFDFLLEMPLRPGRPALLGSVCEVVPPRPAAGEQEEALVQEFGERVAAHEAFVARGGTDSVEDLASGHGFGLVRIDWIPEDRTPWNHEIYRQVAVLARLHGLVPVLDLRGTREAPAQERLLLFLEAMAELGCVIATPSSNWKGAQLWSLKLPVLGKAD